MHFLRPVAFDWSFPCWNDIITDMMNRIKQDELIEILNSYGIENVFYNDSKQISPDSMVYIFSGKDGVRYVLLSADYLGGYEKLKMPYDFEFDDGLPYSKVSFRAVKVFSYKKNAKKKAKGYIDDNHYWTKASTGDVCMLFAIDGLK